jgi:hypothetical protein
MAKYSVSVWNSEFVYATSEQEAELMVRADLADGAIRARDFEYDDIELVEESENKCDSTKYLLSRLLKLKQQVKKMLVKRHTKQ